MNSVELATLSNDGLVGRLTLDSLDIDCNAVKVHTSSDYSCSSEESLEAPQVPNTSGDVPETTSSPGVYDATSGGGVSGDTIIGLGVGFGVGLPVVILLAFLLWSRSRRRSARLSPRSVGAEAYSKDSSASDAVSPNRYSKVTSEQHIEETVRPVSSLISHRASAPAERGRT